MRGLTDKVVLVAGGGGIGFACAERLAAEGALVVVGDIDIDTAQKTVGRITASGGESFGVQYDQGDEESIVALVAATVKRFGRLDGMHANAAALDAATVGRDRQVAKMEVDVWERTLKVNLVGYATLIREALPHLLESGGGGIVCTSSDASAMGQPAQPAYAASKAGINSLVRHVATKYGKQGIRANAVSPGLVLSPAALAAQSEEALQGYRESTLSNRLGTPDDIAAVVAFLLSDDASWITGQVWSVDGGMVLRD